MTVKSLANLIDNHNMVAVFRFNDSVKMELRRGTISFDGSERGPLNLWYKSLFKEKRQLFESYYYLAHLVWPREYKPYMEDIMKYFIKCYPYNSKHNIVRFKKDDRYVTREFKGQLIEEAIKRATKFGVLKKWYKDEKVAREHIEVLYPVHKMYNKKKQIMPKQGKKIQAFKLVNIIDRRTEQTWRIPRWRAEDVIERFPKWFSYTTKSKHKSNRKKTYKLLHIKTGKVLTVPKDKALKTLSTYPMNTKFRLADGLQYEAKKVRIDGKDVIKPVLKKRMRPKLRKSNYPTDRLRAGRMQKVTYTGEKKIYLDTYKEKGDFIDAQWVDNNFPKYKGLDYEVIDWSVRNSKGEEQNFSRLFVFKPVKKVKWVYRHPYRSTVSKPGFNKKKNYPQPKTSSELIPVNRKVINFTKIAPHREAITE
jgi:hypothetical protein